MYIALNFFGALIFFLALICLLASILIFTISLVFFILFDFSNIDYQYIEEASRLDLYVDIDSIFLFSILFTTLITPVVLLFNLYLTHEKKYNYYYKYYFIIVFNLCLIYILNTDKTFYDSMLFLLYIYIDFLGFIFIIYALYFFYSRFIPILYRKIYNYIVNNIIYIIAVCTDCYKIGFIFWIFDLNTIILYEGKISYIGVVFAFIVSQIICFWSIQFGMSKLSYVKNSILTFFSVCLFKYILCLIMPYAIEAFINILNNIHKFCVKWSLMIYDWFNINLKNYKNLKGLKLRNNKLSGNIFNNKIRSKITSNTGIIKWLTKPYVNKTLNVIFIKPMLTNLNHNIPINTYPISTRIMWEIFLKHGQHACITSINKGQYCTIYLSIESPSTGAIYSLPVYNKFNLKNNQLLDFIFSISNTKNNSYFNELYKQYTKNIILSDKPMSEYLFDINSIVPKINNKNITVPGKILLPNNDYIIPINNTIALPVHSIDNTPNIDDYELNKFVHIYVYLKGDMEGTLMFNNSSCSHIGKFCCNFRGEFIGQITKINNNMQMFKGTFKGEFPNPKPFIHGDNYLGPITGELPENMNDEIIYGELYGTHEGTNHWTEESNNMQVTTQDINKVNTEVVSESSTFNLIQPTLTPNLEQFNTPLHNTFSPSMYNTNTNLAYKLTNDNYIPDIPQFSTSYESNFGNFTPNIPQLDISYEPAYDNFLTTYRHIMPKMPELIIPTIPSLPIIPSLPSIPIILSIPSIPLFSSKNFININLFENMNATFHKRIRDDIIPEWEPSYIIPKIRHTTNYPEAIRYFTTKPEIELLMSSIKDPNIIVTNGKHFLFIQTYKNSFNKHNPKISIWSFFDQNTIDMITPASAIFSVGMINSIVLDNTTLIQKLHSIGSVIEGVSYKAIHPYEEELMKHDIILFKQLLMPNLDILALINPPMKNQYYWSEENVTKMYNSLSRSTSIAPSFIKNLTKVFFHWNFIKNNR